MVGEELLREMYLLAPEGTWTTSAIGQSVQDNLHLVQTKQPLLEGNNHRESFKSEVDKLKPFQDSAALKQHQVGILEVQRRPVFCCCMLGLVGEGRI